MRIAAVLLLAAGLLSYAYASTWSADWVYEDQATRTSAATNTSWQRAVTNATWRWTPTPRSAHLLGLSLHVGIAALLGLLAWRLGLQVFGAWLVALLWLLHPMAVETAAYAKARSDQIVLIGTLVSMIAASGRWWTPVGLCGLVGGAVLAIGGEPSGVVVLLLVPLAGWHARDREEGARPAWAPWWLLTAGSLTLIVGGIVSYGGLRTVVNADMEAGIVDVTALTWADWLLAQGGAVGYWLAASVWPSLLTPDLDVDSFSMVMRASGLVALVALAIAAWERMSTAPVVAFGLLMVVVAVLPRLIVQTPRSYLNAAQFALSFMGVLLAAGAGAQVWRERWTASSVKGA